MTKTDVMDRPYRLFIIGLLITTIVTLLLYKFLPTYNLLGGQSLIYTQGKSTPEIITNEESYTNTDILSKLGVCYLVYWTIFILIYLALTHLTKIKFESRYVKLHFALSVIAFVFTICLNNKITLASTYFNSGQSDLYISADISKYDTFHLDKQIQFRDALTSMTSLIGITILLVGTGTFITNVNKGLKRIES